MSMRFPRAVRLQFGFDPREDRLVMVLGLADGGARKVLISRRVLRRFLQKLPAELANTHPVAEKSPSPDEVLQMEHLAAVAGTKRADRSGGDRASAGEAGPGAGAAESGAADGADADDEPPAYLVTDVNLETQGGHVMVGFMGERRNAHAADGDTAEAVAGLRLSRGDAHRVLRRLRDQAREVEWEITPAVPWMAPIKKGAVGN